MFDKLHKCKSYRLSNLNLIRTYVYTGEYTPEMMTAFRRQCGSEIRDMNNLLAESKKLAAKVDALEIEEETKEQISLHLKTLKDLFKDHKEEKQNAILVQNKRSESQKKTIEYFDKQNFLKLRTRPLQVRNCYISQKGVDVKLATDLVQLGYTNSYDIAILLTGDTDLIESVKLVREKLGKIVIICSYYNKGKNSVISDKLIYEADFFINLRDLTDEEINQFSDRYKK